MVAAGNVLAWLQAFLEYTVKASRIHSLGYSLPKFLYLIRYSQNSRTQSVAFRKREWKTGEIPIHNSKRRWGHSKNKVVFRAVTYPHLRRILELRVTFANNTIPLYVGMMKYIQIWLTIWVGSFIQATPVRQALGAFHAYQSWWGTANHPAPSHFSVKEDDI